MRSPLAVGAPSARTEWRANWHIVLAAAAGMSISTLHINSLSVMIAPLEQAFGWSRTSISSGLFISSLGAVLLSPVVGAAVDRFGPRRIGVVGVMGYCLALAALSQATASLWLWWILWGTVAVAYVCIKPTVWVTALSSMFITSRGLAFAVTLSATGLCAALAPAATHFLVEHHGWRFAYVTLALIAAVIALPPVYLFFSSASDKARLRRDGAARVVPEQAGLTLRGGLRSGHFYRLAAAGLCMGIVSMAITVNLVPILTADGIARGDAAGIAGLIGLSSVVGRLSSGVLLDKFNARIVAAVSVLLPAFTCTLLLAAPGSLATAMLAVIFLGLAAGAELDAISYLAVKYFGMHKIGVLYGTIAGFVSLGVGIGPLVANYAYDLTHSYHPVLCAAAIGALATSILFLTLGAYPAFAHQNAAGTPADGT